MTRTEKLILLKNVVANVLRGSMAALVAVLLPPFLTRLMSPDAYGAWSLILQISAYVGYLDFGIQTAVGRYVAHCNEIGDVERRDRIVSTSMAALTFAGIAGIIGTLLAASILPAVFRQMPSALLGDARTALVIVGISLAVGLPASLFNGVFVGLQRYEIPAITVGASRALSAVLLVVVARHGGSLTSMAVATAVVNLMSYAFQFLLYRGSALKLRVSPRLVSRAAGNELFSYCFSLTIWSFAMLLVTGLDLMIVGHFQFEAVGAYAVAATLITFLVGLQQAVFNVMIPSTAVQHARGDSDSLGSLMTTATRYGLFLLLLGGLPLILGARQLLTVWAGAPYAARGTTALRLLVAANILRLSAVPYAMTLIGTGQQRLVIATPLFEGFSNLLVSFVAGYYFGAVGVAVGTLVGSVIGVLGNFAYNMPRTIGFKLSRYLYVRDGLLRPCLCATPVIAVALLAELHISPSRAESYVVFGGVLFTTLFLLWHWGLIEPERAKLRSLKFAI